jgi:Tfp pilus assembly protein PilN
MILYLNLLPKREKIKIRLERLYSLIKKETVFLLVILLLLNIGVFYIKKTLEQNIMEVQTVLKQNKEKEGALITKITAFNQDTDSFKEIQANFSNKSKVLLELFRLIPEGITLTSVSLKENNELILEGNSENREQLLRLKENLNNGFMVDINFPLANLLKQKQNRFVIFGTVANF